MNIFIANIILPYTLSIMNTEQYQGQDLDGDGEEDYAICQPNQGDMAFYSLYAPLLGLLQTHNEEHEEVKSQIFPKRHVSVYIKRI